MGNNKKFGVALSGGGYRAAGFHVGTLKKLNELRLLDRVDVMSTISGGSITGAFFCLHKGSFADFEKEMVSKLSTKNVIVYILSSWKFMRLLLVMIFGISITVLLLFTKYAPLALFPLPITIFYSLKFQFKLFPVSKIIEKAYDQFFFSGATLSMLCVKPELAVGSTNLQTGRQFTFSRRKMEDSYYAYLPKPVKFCGDKFPVARAVVASSCVPFAFTPIEIDKSFYIDESLYDKVQPKLIDGGVYDNQGIHKLTQYNSSYSCEVILVSDAGSNLNLEGFYNNTITLLLRTVNLFMGRIKNFQMMQSIYRKDQTREIAYQSLGWDLNFCISGFMDNLKQGNVPSHILVAHKMPIGWIENPSIYMNEMENFLRVKCRESEILSQSIDQKTLSKIRKIGTNLTPINEKLLRDMISYASDLTEIQLRLYCPSLF